MNSSSIIALDPGPTQSAWLIWDGTRILQMAIDDNEQLLTKLRHEPSEHHLAIEMVASFGMAVGAEVFETVLWVGRFIEAWAVRGRSYEKVYRLRIKQHHCHDSRAKDTNIRAAIVDRFGGKERAIGRIKSKGPLYGVSSHLWSALAIALYAQDIRQPAA